MKKSKKQKRTWPSTPIVSGTMAEVMLPTFAELRPKEKTDGKDADDEAHSDHTEG